MPGVADSTYACSSTAATVRAGWRETPDADAAPTESAMIGAFGNHHGRLPFANGRL